MLYTLIQRTRSTKFVKNSKIKEAKCSKEVLVPQWLNSIRKKHRDIVWWMMHSREHKYIVSLKFIPVHVQVCTTDVTDVPRYTSKSATQQCYARAETAVSAAVSGGESKDVGGDG